MKQKPAYKNEFTELALLQAKQSSKCREKAQGMSNTHTMINVSNHSEKHKTIQLLKRSMNTLIIYN